MAHQQDNVVDVWEELGLLLQQNGNDIPFDGNPSWDRVDLSSDADIDNVSIDTLRELACQTVTETTLHEAMQTRKKKRSFLRALLKALELNNVYRTYKYNIGDVVQDRIRSRIDHRDAMDGREHPGQNYYKINLIRKT